MLEQALKSNIDLEEHGIKVPPGKEKLFKFYKDLYEKAKTNQDKLMAFSRLWNLVKRK